MKDIPNKYVNPDHDMSKVPSQEQCRENLKKIGCTDDEIEKLEITLEGYINNRLDKYFKDTLGIY